MWHPISETPELNSEILVKSKTQGGYLFKVITVTKIGEKFVFCDPVDNDCFDMSGDEEWEYVEAIDHLLSIS